MKLIFKHIKSDIELENIKEKWKLLDNQTKHQNICSSYGWIFNWWSVFKNIENNKIGFDKELFIICAYEETKLVCICPIMKLKRKKFGFSFSFIEFIGQQWGGVYYDIIADLKIKSIYNEIQAYLHENLKFDFIYLRYIPTSSQHYEANQLFPFAQCPEIRISDYLSFDDYLKFNYSKGHKQNIRTGRNRALKNNDILEENIDDFNEKNFEYLISLSKSKLNDDKFWLYGDKHKKEFYRRIHKVFDSNIVFISINNTKVAYRTNIIFNNVKLCTDASYDRNAPKYELGILSVNKNIEDSFKKSLTLHSLGPGLEPYKSKFTKRKSKLFFLFNKGNTAKSTITYPFLNLMIKHKK